jgi:hypothetical protein
VRHRSGRDITKRGDLDERPRPTSMTPEGFNERMLDFNLAPIGASLPGEGLG